MPISVTRFIIPVLAVSFASAGAPLNPTSSSTAAPPAPSRPPSRPQRMGKSVMMVCPEKPPRRADRRRPRLDRLRQQGRHRRPLPRVLPSRLAALRQARSLALAEARASTATRGRAPRPSTRPPAPCGSSSRTSPSRSTRPGSRRLKIPIVRNAWLDREKGVKKEGDRIVSITTLDGKTYAAKMFIDATYEGDLMAAAGVDYHVGRESTSTYGEKWNGVQTGVLHHRHHFGAVKTPISPYVDPRRSRRAACSRASAPSLPASTARATRRCRPTASACA